MLRDLSWNIVLAACVAAVSAAAFAPASCAQSFIGDTISWQTEGVNLVNDSGSAEVTLGFLPEFEIAGIEVDYSVNIWSNFVSITATYNGTPPAPVWGRLDPPGLNLGSLRITGLDFTNGEGIAGYSIGGTLNIQDEDVWITPDSITIGAPDRNDFFRWEDGDRLTLTLIPDGCSGDDSDSDGVADPCDSCPDWNPLADDGTGIPLDAFSAGAACYFNDATVVASEALDGLPALTLDNADDLLPGNPVSLWARELARLFVDLGLPLGISSDVVSVDLWTQGASDYAGHAEDYPWYFAHRYTTQQDAPGAGPEIDEIIVTGQNLLDFEARIRQTDTSGDSDLFDALIARYKDATRLLQEAVDAKIVEVTQTRWPLLTDGTVTLDPWGTSFDQDISDLLDPLDEIEAFFPDCGPAGETVMLDMPNDAPYLGYATFGPDILFETVVFDAMTKHLVEMQKAAEAGIGPNSDGYFKLRAYITADNDANAVVHLGIGPVGFHEPGNTATRTRRSVDVNPFVVDLHRGGQPFPWDPGNPCDTARSFAVAWDLQSPFMRYLDADNPAPGQQLGILIPLKEKFAESAEAVDDGDKFADAGTFIWDFSNPTLPLLNTAANVQDFYDYRVVYRAEILSDLGQSGTDLHEAARSLNNVQALIEAYLSLGMPDADVDLSGLHRSDVITLIADMAAADADQASSWADREFSVLSIKPIMDARIDAVADDIALALAGPAPQNTDVEPVLTALHDLRDNHLTLAVDDYYAIPANGPVTIGAAQGLLANDASQPSRLVQVDPLSVTPPDSGSVDVASNGGFVFTPDPGFVGGTVSFSYRATSVVGLDGPTILIVRSDPATVTLDAACLSDYDGDGSIGPTDIPAFITSLELEVQGTDLNFDGWYDMFDLLLFLQFFDTQCGD